MFKFFKKDKQEKKIINQQSLSDSEIKEIRGKLQLLIEEEKLIPEKNTNEKSVVFEKIGLIQSDLGNTDDAIKSLEQSLSFELSIGDGYKKLMSLYNKKRAEAAKQGNDSGIDYYMNKMDEMRQIAKKVTLSR